MPRLVCLVAAAGIAGAGLPYVHAGQDAGANAPLSRQQVRHELLQARTENRMTPAGEIGDTVAVLAARDAYNRRQAGVPQDAKEQEAIANRQALDELVADLQARDVDDNRDTMALTSAD